MPIVIALLVLVALIAGVVYAFHAIEALWGETAAVCISVAVMLILAALVVRWVQRRREIAANSKDGDWTHVLVQPWGGVRVSATKGLLWLSVDGRAGQYILADLTECAASEADGRWFVQVTVRDEARADWKLPMSSKQEAGRWARILSLAQTQRL